MLEALVKAIGLPKIGRSNFAVSMLACLVLSVSYSVQPEFSGHPLMPFDFRGGEQSPQSIEGNDLASPCLQHLGNTSGPHTATVSFSTSQEGPAEIVLPSSPDEIPCDRMSYAAGDDDTCVHSDRELCNVPNYTESGPCTYRGSLLTCLRICAPP